MAFSDRKATNWGCILGAVIAVPVGFFIFVIGAMGGGGCEGRPLPCDGDYTPMWLMLGTLLVASILLATLINFVVSRMRNRGD